LKGVRASGFTEPTAIQGKAIPIILQGNDLIGSVQSGSGKTGSYLIPILARLVDGYTRLRAIVLAPTRELAQYVETRARDYARFTNLKIAVVFTGAPLHLQERQLRDQPVDLLVATPGRLLELHARGCLNFEDVEMLVLDEGDRMVGLGLAPDLRKLLKLLPETRQTLLYSITMPPELNRLAKEALIEPVRVDLAPPAKPSTGITQAIYPVPKDLKPDLLDETLARTEVRSTILFARSRSSAERIAKMLQRRGYSVQMLDDHPSQGSREQALDDLKRGRIQVLAGSDAAARSLDVTGVSHVVNFDVPESPEDYVHRLGRTGRADPVGDAFTLMSPEEQPQVAAIERFLGRAIPRVMLPDFDYGMRPREIKQAVSYDESERARKNDGGLLEAAARIAQNARPAGGAARPAAPGRRPAAARPKVAAAARAKTPARPAKSKSVAKPKAPAHRAARASNARPRPSPAKGSRTKKK
jgi:ATP-dependent RNA helicase RhlE